MTPRSDRAPSPATVASPAAINAAARCERLEELDPATAEAIVEVSATDASDWLFGVGAIVTVVLALAGSAVLAAAHCAVSIKPIVIGVCALAPLATVLLQRRRMLRELADLGLESPAAREALRRLARARSRHVDDGGQRSREIEELRGR